MLLYYNKLRIKLHANLEVCQVMFKEKPLNCSKKNIKNPPKTIYRTLIFIFWILTLLSMFDIASFTDFWSVTFNSIRTYVNESF